MCVKHFDEFRKLRQTILRVCIEIKGKLFAGDMTAILCHTSYICIVSPHFISPGSWRGALRERRETASSPACFLVQVPEDVLCICVRNDNEEAESLIRAPVPAGK